MYYSEFEKGFLCSLLRANAGAQESCRETGSSLKDSVSATNLKGSVS